MTPMDIDLNSGLHEVIAKAKVKQPQHTNRLSMLDDPCLRRLYYARAEWDKAAEPDDGLQGTYMTGNALEPVIYHIAQQVGESCQPRWRIVGNQIALNDALLKRYQISGTIDGVLQLENGDRWETVSVVDVKTMSPNVYPRIMSYDDLTRYPWTARYRGQLMGYALGFGTEWCSLLLVNKANLYDMRFVHFPLDYQYAEGLLRKAEVINAAIEKHEPPAGVNDPKICPRCPWFAFCAPDMTLGGNLTIADDGELEAILERMAELEPQASQYAELERARDALLVKGRNVAVGRWLILWTQDRAGRWRKEIMAGPVQSVAAPPSVADVPATVPTSCTPSQDSGPAF